MDEVVEDEFNSEGMRAFEAGCSVDARLEALEMCVLAVMGQMTADKRQGESLIHTLRGLAERHRRANGHAETIGILEIRADGLERRTRQRGAS